MKADVARMIKDGEDQAKATALRRSQEILVDAMRHGALDYIAEYTVSTIRVDSEEVKGRIIGKEGRNIRSFENTTGVDVNLDEEGVIRLSCFDPVRREIARRSLEILIKDTRIQPVRIEEVVNQVKKEIDAILFEEGEKLAHEVGVFNLQPDLISMLGRFKFRTSFGQNLVVHTLEETKIGIQIASEIGADVDIVRLGCLFHDIGKIYSLSEAGIYGYQTGAHECLNFALLAEPLQQLAIADWDCHHMLSSMLAPYARYRSEQYAIEAIFRNADHNSCKSDRARQVFADKPAHYRFTKAGNQMVRRLPSS